MILVTGSAGFIGGHLVRRLHGNGRDYALQDVLGLDIRVDAGHSGHSGSFFQTDIRSDFEMNQLIEMLPAGEVHACVHLAAVASPPIAIKDPATAWATNVQGTHNVLQLCHRIGCKRVIFMSSAHVYGISPRYMPTDEQHPLALLDTYTTTKIMGEQLCEQFYRHHGLSYCTLRLWNAYGPGQSKDYFIGAKLRQAAEGKLTIRNAGVTKDWISVTDVVRAIELALASDYVGPLNVGTGKETSLQVIADRIADAYGVPIVPEDVPAEGPTRMCADWKRIANVLHWQPRIAFEDGLAELIADAKREAA